MDSKISYKNGVKKAIIPLLVFIIFLLCLLLLMNVIRTQFSKEKSRKIENIKTSVSSELEVLDGYQTKLSFEENVFETYPVMPVNDKTLCGWEGNSEDRFNNSSLAKYEIIPDDWFMFYVPLTSKSGIKETSSKYSTIKCDDQKIIDPNYYIYLRIKDDEFITDDELENFGEFLKFNTFDYLNINLTTYTNEEFSLLVLLRKNKLGELQPVLFDKKFNFENNLPNSRTAVFQLNNYYYIKIRLDPSYFGISDLADEDIQNEKKLEAWKNLFGKAKISVQHHDFSQANNSIITKPLQFVGNVKTRNEPVEGALRQNLINILPICGEFLFTDDWSIFANGKEIEKPCIEVSKLTGILKKTMEWIVNPEGNFKSSVNLIENDSGKVTLKFDSYSIYTNYETYLIPGITIIVILGFFLMIITTLPEKLMINKIKNLVNAVNHSREKGEVEIPYLDSNDEVGILANETRKTLVAEKEAELERKKFKVLSTSEKARAKAHEDCVYVLRHELNNFIADVLIKSEKKSLIERAKFAKSFMKDLDGLFNSSLDLSSIKNNLSVHSIDEVVTKYLDLLEPNKKEVIRKVVENDNVNVYCEIGKVHQVLHKFVENALEYKKSNDSMIEIGITKKSPEGFVGIYVYNEGSHIHSEQIERFFRPLSSRQIVKNDKGHLGIGVAMARAYALSMGGNTTVENMKNGVSFIIYLQQA